MRSSDWSSDVSSSDLFNHPAVASFWLCGIEVIVRRFFTGQVSAPRSPAAGAVIERALDGGWQDAGCRAADPIGIVAGMAFVVFGASLDRPGAVAAFCHFDNGYANGREGPGLLFGLSGCGIIATGHQNIIVGQLVIDGEQTALVGIDTRQLIIL